MPTKYLRAQFGRRDYSKRHAVAIKWHRDGRVVSTPVSLDELDTMWFPRSR